MRRILTAIIFSIGVACILCAYLIVRRVLFQGRIDAIEIGVLFLGAIAAFWMLSLKEWAQSKSTQRERELDDLSSIDDELVKLVRKNDAFSFIKRNVVSADIAIDYSWVIQCKTFDFNAAIVKVKLSPESRFDEGAFRRRLKSDLKRTCGGWLLRPLVLGVVVESSASHGWSADSFIDHNYAGGCGIAWMILLGKNAQVLSSAHFPRILRTTCFFDDFVKSLLAKKNSATQTAGATVRESL